MRVVVVFSMFLSVVAFGESGGHAQSSDVGSRPKASSSEGRSIARCMNFKDEKKNPSEGNNDYLRKLQVGRRCFTSKGFEFELVKRTANGSEVWKDIKTGYLWGDHELRISAVVHHEPHGNY